MTHAHPSLRTLQWTALSVFLLALSACAGVGSSRNVDDASVPGQVLAAQVCSNCHGLTGESVSPNFPKLAGQQKDYLLAQLADFKGHERSDSRGTQYMWGFTHLTTKQVDELADYFATQPPMAAGKVDRNLLARGADIFNNGIPDKGVVQCMACHGPDGAGNSSFPRIAGQHAEYLLEQIKVFQLTDHRPRGAAMKQVTHELSNADAVAVAAYAESLGRTH